MGLIYARLIDCLVFHKLNPFPNRISITLTLRSLQGVRRRDLLEAVVEESPVRAALWDEVKDRLPGSAYGLSGGQQQRLCIARALATRL